MHYASRTCPLSTTKQANFSASVARKPQSRHSAGPDWGRGGPSARGDRRLIASPVTAKNLDPALTGGVFSSRRPAPAVRRQLERVADLRAARAGALLLDPVARVGLRHAIPGVAVVDHQGA